MEQPDAEPLAGPVVLGDERRLELPRGFHDPVPPDRRDGLRRADAARFQRRVLRHLAHLELQRPARVQHAPAVPLQPGQHRRRVLRPVAVVAGMRRRAHPVVEDALRRRLAQVESAGIEKPLRVRQAALVERRAQRLDPGLVLVKDVDAAHVPVTDRREPPTAGMPLGLGHCDARSASITRFGRAKLRMRAPPRRPRSPPPDATVTNCSPSTM